MELRLRRGKRPLRAARRIGGQLDRALEESRCGCETTTRLRSGCGTLQVGGDALVGDGCPLRAVPGAAVRVGLWIGRFRERAVNPAPLVWLGGTVNRGADKRMSEGHGALQRQQTFRFDGLRGFFRDPELLGCAPEKGRIAERLGCC